LLTPSGEVCDLKQVISIPSIKSLNIVATLLIAAAKLARTKG